ncbi:MAG: ABC-2 family transporter protein [Actinomycetota bacterium]|nr:ABC-2 family transporter protein [Actinomycetota bacterium]
MHSLALLVRAGFRRESTYLAAMFGGLLTNVVFGFIRASILFAAVDSAGGQLAGYTHDTISAYVWLSQGLIGAVMLTGTAEIGQRVRTGEVAVDFLRPLDVQASHLATDLGRAAFTLIPRGLPSVLVGAATVGLVMPTTAQPYLLGLLSVLLGVTLSFLTRFAVNLAGFWIIETRGVTSLLAVVQGFLSGLYVPVHLFPGWLGGLAASTPFPSILQAPIDVLSGRVTGPDALGVVVVQLAWVAAVAALGQVLLRSGRRRLEVQGG